MIPKRKARILLLAINDNYEDIVRVFTVPMPGNRPSDVSPLSDSTNKKAVEKYEHDLKTLQNWEAKKKESTTQIEYIQSYKMYEFISIKVNWSVEEVKKILTVIARYKWMDPVKSELRSDNKSSKSTISTTWRISPHGQMELDKTYWHALIEDYGYRFKTFGWIGAVCAVVVSTYNISVRGDSMKELLNTNKEILKELKSINKQQSDRKDIQ